MICLKNKKPQLSSLLKKEETNPVEEVGGKRSEWLPPWGPLLPSPWRLRKVPGMTHRISGKAFEKEAALSVREAQSSALEVGASDS